MEWYVVHVYSGFEQRVSQSILEQSKQKNIDDIKDILVPMQQTVEISRGRKYTAERKFFPGYIMVQMEMNNESWHLVKDTPKVTDFLGNNGIPIPISEQEVLSVKKQIEEGVSLAKTGAVFTVGDAVRVTDGPFASFNGNIEEVDEERSQIKVLVAIFGRATPVVLSYSQVEKV